MRDKVTVCLRRKPALPRSMLAAQLRFTPLEDKRRMDTEVDEEDTHKNASTD